MFENPTKPEIDALLLRIRTIAILGVSETAGKPSHHVAAELQKFGYRIVPVNPTAKEILGEKAWPYVTWILAAPILSLVPIPIVSTLIAASPLSIKFLLGRQLNTAIREAAFAD